MNIKDCIRKRIETADGEEVFFISDFTRGGNDVFVSRMLSELVAEGLIARIGNGVFYKPVKTRFGDLAPGIETIVKAIARRDKAEIMPTGPTAENMLGLSTQVPSTVIRSHLIDYWITYVDWNRCCDMGLGFGDIRANSWRVLAWMDNPRCCDFAH